MRKILRYFFTSVLTITLLGAASAQTSLMHSFSFKDSEPVDDVTGEEALLMGEAFIEGTALVLPDATSYLDMSSMGFEINTYEALTLEIWATSEAAANTGYTMICYLGGTTGGLGTQGCFISAARGDDVSRGAISTVSLTAPYGANETGVNGPEFDDGIQHSYVLTIDDASVKFYIDGEPLGLADLAVIGNSIPDLSNDFAYLGKGGYTADPCWIGSIHKFNIYNEVLSDEAIAQLKVDANVTKVTQLSNKFKPLVYAAQNQIHVSLNNTNSVSGKVEVFNLSGQKMDEVKFCNNASIAAVSGIYFVKVTADNYSYSQKISVR